MQEIPISIVLTGPESSGKSSLVDSLARQFAAPQCEEFARRYFAQRSVTTAINHYLPSELLYMAKQQSALEQIARQQAQSSVASIYFADTDVLTIYIWWTEKFGSAPISLTKQLVENLTLQPRHYFLCMPDLPWQEDPLRENPNDRDRIFDIYQHHLTAMGADFSIIKNLGVDRHNYAAGMVENLIK